MADEIKIPENQKVTAGMKTINDANKVIYKVIDAYNETNPNEKIHNYERFAMENVMTTYMTPTMENQFFSGLVNMIFKQYFTEFEKFEEERALWNYFSDNDVIEAGVGFSLIATPTGLATSALPNLNAAPVTTNGVTSGSIAEIALGANFSTSKSYEAFFSADVNANGVIGDIINLTIPKNIAKLGFTSVVNLQTFINTWYDNLTASLNLYYYAKAANYIFNTNGPLNVITDNTSANILEVLQNTVFPTIERMGKASNEFNADMDPTTGLLSNPALTQYSNTTPNLNRSSRENLLVFTGIPFRIFLETGIQANTFNQKLVELDHYVPKENWKVMYKNVALPALSPQGSLQGQATLGSLLVPNNTLYIIDRHTYVFKHLWEESLKLDLANPAIETIRFHLAIVLGKRSWSNAVKIVAPGLAIMPGNEVPA